MIVCLFLNDNLRQMKTPTSSLLIEFEIARVKLKYVQYIIIRFLTSIHHVL